MIQNSLILIISLSLLSPLPFVSPWHEDAYAQANTSTTGPPVLAQNQTSTKPLETFMAYKEIFAKIPDLGRANTTATNLAHDMLMDVRGEYVELNRTSHQLNRTLADLAAVILDEARTRQNFGIFGSLAIQTNSDARILEMLQNGTIEYIQAREELKSKTNQFKISPHVYAHFEDTDKKIQVYINLVSNNSNVSLGGDEIITQLDKTILAALTESRIREIAKDDQIESIRLPHATVSTAGSYTSQGVSASQADILHNMGITGKDVTVAIIDNAFNLNDAAISPRVSYSALFASCDDLLCGESANSHGTRVSHIVADMAPDANLELYAVSYSIGVVEAISHIISRGTADVLSISLNIPGLGGDGSTKYYRDGTSHVAQAVDRARESGILVTVSAGNAARDHWRGTYIPSSTVTPELIDGLDSYQSILEVNPSASGLKKACLSTSIGGSGYIVLAWDAWDQNPLYDDYDLFLFNDDMSQLYGYSTEWQLFNGQPLEYMIPPTESGSKCIVVASKYSTENHTLHIHASTTITPNVAAGSMGTPADARGAVSVGAVLHSTNALRSFSSMGPTDDGREKPEICGYDGVSTPGGAFSGTSASAPHVAGMAALLLDANPLATPDDIQRSIETSAKSGPDACGAGIMSLHDASELLPDVTISGRAGDSYVKTGDLITISVSANNTVSHASATILDRLVPVNYAGSVANAAITVLENDTQGLVDFSLNIIDINGNLVTATPRFLTDSNIQVDTVIPNMESSYASSLNSITVVFSEDIRAESVSVDDFVMDNTDITSYEISSNMIKLSTSILDISSLPNVNLSGSVEDLAGNSLSAVSIPTLVGFDTADIIPPKFVSLSIDSNNLNTAFAKTNDVITVNLATDDTVSSADATIFGRTVQPIISGNSVTFDTSVSSNDIEGLVNFALNVSDQQNNTLQITQANLTTDNVLVDMTPPELLSIKTVSDGIIVANFSEVLDDRSVSSTNFNTINVDLIAVASIENTVSIKTDSFAPDEIIEVNIKGTLSDLAGNLLTLDTSNNTMDGIRPMMINAYPDDNRTIIVQFDESVKSPIQPSDFQISNMTVQSARVLSPNNYIELKTVNPFGDDDLLSISINGTVEDLSGNLALQNIFIEFSGSLNSLSAIFTAQRINTTMIELSFTLDGEDAIDLNVASYNTDAFSIIDPSTNVLSWTLYPYLGTYSTLINRYLPELNLENHDHFGASLASADFDGDGQTDLAVSAPGNGTGSISIVYLDQYGTPENPHIIDLSMFNNLNFDMFGMTLAADDFDGDGVPDLAIGVPGESSGSGAVYVAYLNSDGTVDSSVNIASSTTAMDAFGTSLAAGDFDGDGVPDLAIGAPGESSGSGAVHVAYLNSDGTVDSSVNIASSTTAMDAFGTSLAAGDFDGDGILDLAIGAPGESNGSGAVHVAYLNSDGTVKDMDKTSDPKYTGFGYALSVMDDLDNDGRSEFAVTSLEQTHGIIRILHPSEDGITSSATSDFDYGYGTSLSYIGILSDGLSALATGIPFSSYELGTDSKNGGIDHGTVAFLYFGDKIRITTSEIQNPNDAPLVTYNAHAQSNLIVNGVEVANGTSAVASSLNILESARTVNASAVNVTFRYALNESTVTSTDFLIDGMQPTETIVYDNVVTLITNTAFSPDATPYIEYVGMIQDLSGYTIVKHSLSAMDGILPKILSATTITPYLISVEFDEPITTSTITSGVVSSDTGSITTLSIKDGPSIPSSILDIEVSLTTPLPSGAVPIIKLGDFGLSAISDIAGNEFAPTDVQASDGIPPSLHSATVVSPTLIEVYFDEPVQLVPNTSTINPPPSIDGKFATSNAISGDTLSIFSPSGAFQTDAILNISFTTSSIIDLAGNTFASGYVLTSESDSLQPYTINSTTIIVPYTAALDLNSLSTSDYRVSFDSNPPSGIRSVEIFNDTIVIITMQVSFGTGAIPFVEQPGTVTDILGNTITMQSAIARDRASPLLVIPILSTSTNTIAVEFSEAITSPSNNIANYDLSSTDGRSAIFGPTGAIITTSPFLDATFEISAPISIQDLTGNIANGTDQRVVINR